MGQPGIIHADKQLATPPLPSKSALELETPTPHTLSPSLSIRRRRRRRSFCSRCPWRWSGARWTSTCCGWGGYEGAQPGHHARSLAQGCVALAHTGRGLLTPPHTHHQWTPTPPPPTHAHTPTHTPHPTPPTPHLIHPHHTPVQRFWGDHPEVRASLPDLSDRILIFCRGFEPARLQGRYLMQKVREGREGVGRGGREIRNGWRGKTSEPEWGRRETSCGGCPADCLSRLEPLLDTYAGGAAAFLLPAGASLGRSGPRTGAGTLARSPRACGEDTCTW